MVALSLLAAALALPGGSAGTMPLTDRLLRTGDLAGFVAESRSPAVVTSAVRWNGRQEAVPLRREGFVAASRRHLMRGDIGAVSSVIRFAAAGGARHEVARHLRQALLAAPLGATLRTFAVRAIPGGYGVSIRFTIPGQGRYGNVLVLYSDGPFLYELAVGGEGALPERAVRDVAAALYRRVHGA